MGVVHWVRWGFVRAEGAAWERYFGGNTQNAFDRRAYADKLESIPYEPLPWFLLRLAMDALPVSQEDVFLDYGSGMGRVLLMAGRRAVKRVIGVELLAPLAGIARQNLTAARSKLRSPVELVVADAATWEVPDDVTVVFLFNPFVGSVMAAAQQQLAASLRRKPRRLRVLYAHASDQPNLFADCPWLRLRQRVEVGVFKGMNVLLYENRPVPLSVVGLAKSGTPEYQPELNGPTGTPARPGA